MAGHLRTHFLDAVDRQTLELNRKVGKQISASDADVAKALAKAAMNLGGPRDGRTRWEIETSREIRRRVKELFVQSQPDGIRTIIAWFPDAPRDVADHPTSLDGFTLAWDHPPRCQYNVAVAKLFASAFIEETHGYDKSDEEAVIHLFLTHVQHLYKKRAELTADPTGATRKRKLQENRMNQRTLQLSARRLSILEEQYLLDSFKCSDAQLRKYLGPDVTSDDEEATAGGKRLYTARPMPWRSDQLKALFRQIDILHLRGREGTPGRKPRTRLPAAGDFGSEELTLPPTGLPENWYNLEYLRNLKDKFPYAYETVKLAMRPPLEVDWATLTSQVPRVTAHTRLADELVVYFLGENHEVVLRRRHCPGGPPKEFVF